MLGNQQKPHGILCKNSLRQMPLKIEDKNA